MVQGSVVSYTLWRIPSVSIFPSLSLSLTFSLSPRDFVVHGDGLYTFWYGGNSYTLYRRFVYD